VRFTEYDHVVQAFPADRAEELARNAGKIDLKQWPGTLIAFFLGQVKLDQMSPPSSHGSMGSAREVCNIHTVHYLAAEVEMKHMGKCERIPS